MTERGGFRSDRLFFNGTAQKRGVSKQKKKKKGKKKENKKTAEKRKKLGVEELIMLFEKEGNTT